MFFTILEIFEKNSVTGGLFTITTSLAQSKYGSGASFNLLQGLPASSALYMDLMLVTMQIFLSMVIGTSAFFQDVEEKLSIPKGKKKIQRSPIFFQSFTGVIVPCNISTVFLELTKKCKLRFNDGNLRFGLSAIFRHSLHLFVSIFCHLLLLIFFDFSLFLSYPDIKPIQSLFLLQFPFPFFQQFQDSWDFRIQGIFFLLFAFFPTGF